MENIKTMSWKEFQAFKGPVIDVQVSIDNEAYHIVDVRVFPDKGTLFTLYSGWSETYKNYYEEKLFTNSQALVTTG